ncbi:MAG: M28 family peptidase [Bacillota bacterium]
MQRTLVVVLILVTLVSGLVGAVPREPDQSGMLADLDLLLQWGDRASGSRSEESAAQLIADRFRELGLQVETQSFTDRGIKSQNVIGIKQGSDPQAGVITVTAHYDSAKPGVPGANDNASGAVTMMELARLWSDRVTSSTIQFIAFGAEERGLIGARHYINTPQAANVVLNLNLDMVGRGGKVGLDRAPAWLIRAIAQSARQHNYPFVLNYATMAAMRNDGSPTDGRPFADKGIPTVSFSSAEGLEDWNYHSPADNRANVDGQDLVRLAVVVNDLIERYDGQRVPWGDKNFIAFSAFGGLVIIAGWVSYLVIGASLIAWIAAWWMRRRGEAGVLVRVRKAAVRWMAAVAVIELIAVLRYRISSKPGYPWHYLLAMLLVIWGFWTMERRPSDQDDQNSSVMLAALGIPVALTLFCAAFAAWDYALMAVLPVIPAIALGLTDCRWRRLAYWTVSLLPFLYLCTSNWLPRAGSIRAILEFAYLPILVLMGLRVLQSWTKSG